jgi:hypothetical protein
MKLLSQSQILSQVRPVTFLPSFITSGKSLPLVAPRLILEAVGGSIPLWGILTKEEI